MPWTLALVDWLASALGIIYIAATPGFPARDFDPISWRGWRKSTVSSPLPRELVFGAQSHCLPSRLNGAITWLSVTESLSSVSIFLSSFTSTFWRWHYFYLLIISLSSWNAFKVYFKTYIFFLFTYVFTCSYVCRYMWMHIFVEARGQPWVSAILFLEAGPLTFTWNLLIQPGQWAPRISLLFSSPALRLQILVTMFGLSVGSEDGTQYLKQFTSWASSPGPAAGTF